MSPDNYVYYGDNLPVLREHVDDESIDLVYLCVSTTNTSK